MRLGRKWYLAAAAMQVVNETGIVHLIVREKSMISICVIGHIPSSSSLGTSSKWCGDPDGISMEFRPEYTCLALCGP